jgi:hypothetical protein
MPQSPKKIVETLTTEVTDSGDECVDRQPRTINQKRADVDVIRIINANKIGSGDDITISIDQTEAADLFSPVPPAEQTLSPGDSVDWTLKSVIAGTVGMRFRTDPDTCTGSDQDDIIIQC